MSVTRVPPHETIAHMLAFRFLNGRAAVCGDSFVHLQRALHRRVHVYKYHLGSLRGVNGSSKEMQGLCLDDKAFMVVVNGGGKH